MPEGMFVRVYHEDLVANYPTVWDDDLALAAWLRLFVIADKLWPSPAELPSGVRKSALTKLVDSGILELLPRHRFRLRGLDADRSKRRQTAQDAAASRWSKGDASSNAGSNANALQVLNANALPHARNPQRAQSVSASVDDSDSAVELGNLRAQGPIVVPVKGMDGKVTEVDVVDGPPADTVQLQKLAEELTQQAYVMANVHGGLGAKAIAEQLARHGFAKVERAWRQIANRVKAEGTSAPTLRQLVLGADDILNPVLRPDDKGQRAEEEAARFDRSVARTRAELARLRGEPT